MDITTIERLTEGGSGIYQLKEFMRTLVIEEPEDPKRRQLIAILAEYTEGQLDKLHCLTVPFADPGVLRPSEANLMLDVADVVHEIHTRRQEEAEVASAAARG